MNITLERQVTHSTIRFHGQLALTSAEELKALLLQGLAEQTDLHLDLEDVEEIDITAMQLLWAAAREAGRRGVSMSGRVSPAVELAVRNAGFAGMAGLDIQEQRQEHRQDQKPD